MLLDNNLLVVAGSGRNVGKTEFICRLMQKISVNRAIYALKVSAIYPDEHLYHGNHSEEKPGNNLFEEKRHDTSKDTSRMLRAGARRVFYLRSDKAGIADGFHAFRKNIPGDALVVCESNSLWQFVRPGLLILIKTTNEQIKSRAVPLLNQADLVIVSDKNSGFPGLDRISCSIEDGWFLRVY